MDMGVLFFNKGDSAVVGSIEQSIDNLLVSYAQIVENCPTFAVVSDLSDLSYWLGIL